MEKVQFKVSRHTHPNKLAAAIIAVSLDKDIECRIIGSKSLRILTFALCIANQVTGGEIKCRFSFSESEAQGNLHVTALISRGGD